MKYYISFILLFFTQYALNSMENKITYHYQLATTKDIPDIVSIFKNDCVHEKDKLVVVPYAFMHKYISKAINNKEMYCALTNNGKIAAFKKLFIINNETTYEDIALNEIRCIGNKSYFNTAASFGILNYSENLLFDIQIPWSFKNSVIIYTGGDYTLQDYRKQKINSFLMDYSLNSIKNEVLEKIKHPEINYLVLLYGLTQFNAGKKGGIDRTPSIVHSLRKFINILFPHNNNNIIHKSYIAYMPTFDLNNTECIPLSDNFSIHGYGNTLIFTIPSHAKTTAKEIQ